VKSQHTVLLVCVCVCVSECFCTMSPSSLFSSRGQEIRTPPSLHPPSSPISPLLCDGKRKGEPAAFTCVMASTSFCCAAHALHAHPAHLSPRSSPSWPPPLPSLLCVFCLLALSLSLSLSTATATATTRQACHLQAAVCFRAAAALLRFVVVQLFLSYRMADFSARQGVPQSASPAIVPPPHRSAFYCSVCDINFSDSHAAEAHKASLKHKKKTGELEWEQRQYKKDGDVTPEDVWALVRRKQAELALSPWEELRCSGPSPPFS
jgi:hypothetical protein